MTRPVGWRVPVGGGVAHFFEADPDVPGRPWTVCGKIREHTPYLHPFVGVEGNWRPCRDCWRRQAARLDVEVTT